MSNLNKPVLILNKNWIPIRVKSVRKAFILASRERAAFIDPNDYSVILWDEWIKITPSEGELYIISTNANIKVPEVLILTHYGKLPIQKPKLTKRNIFIRDKYRCQYTGEKVNFKDGDIDHILPRSKNGKNSWNNLVVCSKALNRKKGDKTLKEAGLKLIRKPTVPRFNDLLIDPRMKIPESWRKFVS